MTKLRRYDEYFVIRCLSLDSSSLHRASLHPLLVENVYRADFPGSIRGNTADAGLVAVLSQMTVAEMRYGCRTFVDVITL